MPLSTNPDQPVLSTQNRLTFSGYGSPDAYVTLYDGNEMIGFTIADAAGNWRVTSDKLADGLHAIYCTATDLAGNVSTPVLASYVSITASANVPPKSPIPAPIEVQLSLDTDSGASSTDHITQVNLPMYVGVAKPGSFVELVIDGVKGKFNAPVDANGNWHMRGEALGDGQHTISVIEHDSDGNVSAPSAAMQLTIDTTAPQKPSAMLVPREDDVSAGGTIITHTSTPEITGTAEAGASVTIYEWDYFLGITKIGNAVADSNGNWSFTATERADGQHKILVKVSDLAGNTAESNLLSFNIDTKAPLLETTSDGGLLGDGVTNQAKPGLYGWAAPGTSVVLYEGPEAIGTGVAGADGIWRITSSKALADGEHKLYIQSTDSHGNALPTSGNLLLTIDTKPLQAISTKPVLDAGDDSGRSSSDQVTSATTLTVRGSADIHAYTVVRVYVDGVEQYQTALNENGDWGTVLSGLSDGAHRVSVAIEDQAGNLGARSAESFITVDTKAPDAPAAPQLDSTANPTPRLVGIAEAGATITLYAGASVVGSTVADSKGAWSITSSKLGDGQHSLTVTATDVAGNTSAASAELSVIIDGTLYASPTTLELLATSDRGASSTDHLTNLVTPTLTGNTAPGTSVVLYEGKTVIGTGVADDDGAWTITPTKALADGAHKLYAQTTDGKGNLLATSTTLIVTVDTKTPDAPAAPKLDSLANATPRVTGKAEAGATVNLYDGGTLVGSTVADSKGAWSITASKLADGKHSFTVTATDLAGNTSKASAALSVTTDGTADAAPTALDLLAVSDKGTSNSDNLTSLATPTITGKAAAGATVLLFDGATQIGKAIASSSGTWSITSSKLLDGEHHVTAVAQDAAGNLSAASAELLITIDTGLPAVSAPVLDPLSDSGRSQNDGITNVTTPKVSGTAEAGATVTLYEGSTVLGTAVADDKGAWSITSKALATGAHNLTAKATDAAGNVSNASAALTVTIDVKAPSAPTALDLAASADNGTSSSDNLTSITTPVVSGKAEANAIVALYDGDTLLGTALADKTGAWSITSSVTLADGVHNLTAKATDVAGNVSLASAALKLSVDTATAAPALLDLAAASDKGASGTDNLTSVTAPVTTGKAEAGATVVLFDGAKQIGKATADNKGVWSITSTKLADGEHHLTATATDAAGNASQASAELVLTVDTKAVQVASAPLLDALSDSGRLQSDGITSITTPKVSGTTEAGASVALYDGNTLVGTALAGDDGNWSINSKALSIGAHKLTIKVTDIAGNVSSASPVLALTVDNKAPDAPTALDLPAIYDSGASGSDNKTAISAPVISGKAEANAIVALYDGDTLLGSALADNKGAWSIATTPLAAGTHSLTAKATDVAGNVSAASAKLALTIDPSATGLALAGTGAADSFALNSEAGAIKVSGFSAGGGDHLLLAHDYNGLSLNSAADVVALGHVDGKNFVLDFGAGHEVTLVGVTSLAESAILFV